MTSSRTSTRHWRRPPPEAPLATSDAGLGSHGRRQRVEMLDLAAEIGSIRPGYLADPLSVAGEPLRDPWALEHVRSVMQGGKRKGTRVSRGVAGAGA